jgi:hypothetical protein
LNAHRFIVTTRFFHRSNHTKPSFSSAISHRSSAAWLQVLCTRSLRFRPEGCTRRRRRRGLCQKAAIGAVKTMEETMRVLTLTELMRLTRTELFALAARMTTALSEFPEGSYEYAAAYVNLRNIRAALARRDFSP